jgi:hypothetical protein
MIARFGASPLFNASLSPGPQAAKPWAKLAQPSDLRAGPDDAALSMRSR